MHIVHLFNSLTYSGAELLLHSASAEFYEGNRHTIITTGDAPGIFADALAEKGYEILHLPFFKSFTYLSAYSRLLRRISPDVLHVHAERAFVFHAGTARLQGIPTLRSLHNEFLFTGRLRILRAVERRVLSMLGVRFIACSQRVQYNEKSRFGINSEIIENWFDPSRIPSRLPEERSKARLDFGIPEDAFVITSIGNYGPAKNHEAIVRATEMCATAYNVYYLHCGANNEKLKAELPAALSERVKFLGPTRDVGSVLCAADLFVSASFFEGGPIALLEGAAAGLNVAATATGLGTAFQGSPGARIIEPTADDVAASIAYFAEMPASQRNTLGRDLASSTAKRFSPSLGTQRFLSVYRQLSQRA